MFLSTDLIKAEYTVHMSYRAKLGLKSHDQMVVEAISRRQVHSIGCLYLCGQFLLIHFDYVNNLIESSTPQNLFRFLAILQRLPEYETFTVRFQSFVQSLTKSENKIEMSVNKTILLLPQVACLGLKYGHIGVRTLVNLVQFFTTL